MTYCNICSCTEFLDFNGRVGVQCKNCRSLERHRLVYEVLRVAGYLKVDDTLGKKRLLHLAPEAMTYKYLGPVFGCGYYAADLHPEKYTHCQALKLSLPDGFDLFPNDYFDLILHNHVLEHIPGSYREHLIRFVQILKPGGHMVFTIPHVNTNSLSVEGGESLPSDVERLRLHGQRDHYKTFGKDFIDFFLELQGRFEQANVSSNIRRDIGAPRDVVFVFQKVGGQ